MRFIITLITVCLLYIPSTCVAEIFKYKDKDGHWQFSDSPINEDGATEVRAYKNSTASVERSNDFITLLNSKYPLTNPVQQATKAVVTVKSKLGSGSGFFVTEDCYLVTNKHVVRPAKGKQWDATQAKIKKNSLIFNSNKIRLNQQKERLFINKQKLDDFRIYIDGLRSDKEKQIALREYALYEQQYQQDLQQLNETQRRLSLDEDIFNRQKSDFNFSSAVSNVAQSFDIVLKDNTKARAKLIKVASTDDLALLKVNACKAPYLEMAPGSVVQGTTVHAIGSPLGLRDQLTDGTVTQVLQNQIVTDAQILPGNSGGPLITDDGYVVAVNTIKVAKGSALKTGFGVSIPIAKVRKNFAEYLNN
ncbi:MAG: S1C family serine protease [Cycloclasticus pugetii]|uniref:Trypsin-like serine protease, typically periplasmic n=1 Tax=Cycloclasticus zancles 78-ME TaxID=1198232 RepID=S5T8P7_9GAMM|nr:Trypsin-like serine protease, typically periplasmic [Cycloclasticus zancles 78-ME]